MLLSRANILKLFSIALFPRLSPLELYVHDRLTNKTFTLDTWTDHVPLNKGFVLVSDPRIQEAIVSRMIDSNSKQFEFHKVNDWIYTIKHDNHTSASMITVFPDNNGQYVISAMSEYDFI